MDTLNMLGTFLNVVAIAFVVVCVLIAFGLITAIMMLVKKVKLSGKGTLPTRKKVTPPKQRNRQLNQRSRYHSRFRTRRKTV